MIKLFREEHSPQADAIEAEFHDLVLGYDRVVLTPAEAVRVFGAEVSLPLITDNARTVHAGQFPAYLKELTQLVRQWQLFQGDYCYVDDDGETC
jgi:uncharacterized protein YecE (DUF72 family)